MAVVWRLEGLTSNQKFILLSLADNANDAGLAWPSIDTVARRCSLDSRTVQRAVKHFIDSGLIKVNARVGRSTEYDLTPLLAVTPGTVSPPSPVTPHPPHGCHPTPLMGDTHNLKGTIREPSEGAHAPAQPPKGKSLTGTRLNSDWDIPEEWGRWAEKQGMSYDEIIREADKFKDHWHSKPGADARKTDWQATWRNWIRRHLERRVK